MSPLAGRVQLFFQEKGSGPETIIFSHGLLFDHRMWQYQVAHFESRYRCVAYDHRGQGHGSRLLKHAVAFAKEKQFLRITLLTHRGEGRLVDFYRKHGFFESEMVTMRLLLTSGSGAAK